MTSLKLYNTLTRKTEPVPWRQPGKASVYCCGPTTYDVTHAGHGRTFSLPDLLVRHLRASGIEVTYARNITDVDDKIVRRAKEQSKAPLELSDYWAGEFQKDMQAMSYLEPCLQPRVSTTMDGIIAIIERLIASEAAYVVDGEHGQDVWYAVRSFEGYGKLSGRKLDEMRAGQGLEERGKASKSQKRDALDFALWKSSPKEEWAFESPWGHGRPGWHIECSAMIEEHLGYGIDIHVGGMDLIFPHHENEIAQSEACHPGEGNFANVWIHAGFLNVDKEKMSKSLGNFVTLRDCFERNDPEGLRYFYLSAHYRGPIEFETDQLPDGRVIFPGVDEAERRADYLYATWRRLRETADPDAAAPAKPIKELAPFQKLFAGTRKQVSEALDDDLNAPVALGHVAELAKAANDLCDLAKKRRKDARFVGAAKLLAHEGLECLRSCTDVLGLLQSSPEEYAERTQAKRLKLRGLSAEAVEAKLAGRKQARADKNWQRSDEIRDELEAWGVETFDTAEGTIWRVKV